MSELPASLAEITILNPDHVKQAAEVMLCGGGNSAGWQACQAVARAYLDDLAARGPVNEPLLRVKGPFRITCDGISEWRVHGPGIDPNTKGWLFRSYGHALDCVQAGNLGYQRGKQDAVVAGT